MVPGLIQSCEKNGGIEIRVKRTRCSVFGTCAAKLNGKRTKSPKSCLGAKNYQSKKNVLLQRGAPFSYMHNLLCAIRCGASFVPDCTRTEKFASL